MLAKTRSSPGLKLELQLDTSVSSGNPELPKVLNEGIYPEPCLKSRQGGREGKQNKQERGREREREIYIYI